MERKNFSWPVTEMDREDYEAFHSWFDQNKDLLRDKQLVIWGAGIRGTAFSILLKEKGFYNFLFTDSNPEKWDGYIDEFLIISPEELENQRNQKSTIVLISVENSAEIEKELDKKGYCKNKDYYVVKTSLYSTYVEDFLRPYGQGTLVMGACEFLTISLRDSDHSSLKEMLLQRCGKDDAKVLAIHAIGLRAEYNIFRAQIRSGMKPKRLLITVNFEMLTGKQHLLPRSQHAELMQMLLNAQKNPSDEFKEYVDLTKERSKNLQMEFFTGPEASEIISEVKARNYIRLNYLYDLDVATEGLEYLLKLLDLASAEGIEVLPFIPPVNYQLGIKLFGNDFKQKYEGNVEKIRKLVTGKGFHLLDLSYSLDACLFSLPTTPSETSNSRGRRKMADLLFNAIQEMKRDGTWNYHHTN